MEKKNFAFGTKVVISRTGAGGEIDGRVGTIVGVASRHIVDCYIVDLGKPISLGGDPETFSAVVFPESCLDRYSIRCLVPE